MSELIDTNAGHEFFRETLLITVCGFALIASTGAIEARTESDEHPTVWIEIGGQLERMGDSEDVFAPSFLGAFDRPELSSVLPKQRPPRYSNGAEGRLLFAPNGSDWLFSAGVRYGRANSKREFNQQLPKFAPIKGQNIFGTVYYITQKIPVHLNSLTDHADRHLVLDFRVGRDVGLGLFSEKGSSSVSLGVRFAQFTSARNVVINGAPNFTVIGTSKKYGLYRSRHHYSGSITADSSFQGVGPSLSWDASAPLFDSGDDSQISVDWGINAAVLFGRQKARGKTQVVGTHYTNFTKFPTTITRHTNAYDHSTNFSRSRRVVVPNVDGFAGISFRYSDVKVSMGYRADLFFGAMDGGIASRKSEDRSFYGPFASFSIGLGG